MYFYAPVEEGVICLALRPSLCLSINFSCLLHNSDTIQDIFMKLGTNVNHHQTMCREQEPAFFTELCHFEIFLMKMVSALQL